MKAIRAGLCFLLTASCFGQIRFASGELAGFTISPNEHMINQLDSVLTVHDVKGVVLLEPSGAPLKDALVEIRGPGESKSVVGATAGDAGDFRIRDVSAGPYMFKVTLDGYQSLMGKLVVDLRARDARPMQLKLKASV